MPTSTTLVSSYFSQTEVELTLDNAAAIQEHVCHKRVCVRRHGPDDDGAGDEPMQEKGSCGSIHGPVAGEKPGKGQDALFSKFLLDWTGLLACFGGSGE